MTFKQKGNFSLNFPVMNYLNRDEKSNFFHINFYDTSVDNLQKKNVLNYREEAQEKYEENIVSLRKQNLIN